MKKILYPFSIIYNFVSNLNRKFTKQQQLSSPVISVGNITWGGSGKTPVVLEIAKYILSLGKMPVILSRGYARRENILNNVIVRDNEKIISDICASGDEPYMMAQNIKCPIIIGRDRIQSAKLSQKFNPDVFILDDGFQHWKLKRDLDIVCINSLNPFGNNMIIPAGILREKTEALKRADIVILTNANLCDDIKLKDIKKKVVSITGKGPLLSFCDNSNITNMSDNSLTDINDLKNKNIVMLCAIGSPDNFRNTIIKLGLNIKQEIILKDHHKYNYKDIGNITAILTDDDVIVTTQKDSVKLKDVCDNKLRKKIYIVNISVDFNAGRTILEQHINKILF
ncbi:MAG: tetraacyldisaccharide 4'-kinase [Endomicrobiaceae bacterium]|nr:tetraacyldisaccharide 4'-kinase [Endomicrobiaceae bacterium]